MNLQKIQSYIILFKKYLKSKEAEQQLYKWESLKFFQDNWNLEEPNMEKMYDASLRNTETTRLWKGNNYTPKRMMLLFAQMAPDYVRHSFKDLFEEEKNIADRVDRFIFYCGELLTEYKTQNGLSIENNHYHDYSIISLYLTFCLPTQYTFYDFPTFQKSMVHLGSRNIPKQNDVERFFKISRTLWKFLERDEEVWQLHQKRLYSSKQYKEKSLLLVHEFFNVIASKKL